MAEYWKKHEEGKKNGNKKGKVDGEEAEERQETEVNVVEEK
jgi:hypothetical protein